MTRPTTTEIMMTRTFDAPPAVVFEAWTQAEHVRRWWDPGGVPLSSCHIDLRPGGTFRWVNSARGEQHVFAGKYREIAPPERVVFTVEILPSSPDAVTTLEFSPEGSGTKLTMTIKCASLEDRDALLQMRIDAGTGQTLDNLAAWLGRRKKFMNNPMKLYSYVNFNGNCREAFDFYAQHLGGNITMMLTHEQAPFPGQVPPDWKKAILHARITVGKTELLAADIPNAQPMRSAYLTLITDSTGEAERTYAALAEGGEIFMPMAETPFAVRFAQLRDQFGINWMILHERARP